jgi:hypothetical protein
MTKIGKVKKGDFVVVSWDDISNMAVWLDQDEIKDFATNHKWRCQNAGWVTYVDDECLVVSARAAALAEQFGLSERIPKKVITHVWKIKT